MRKIEMTFIDNGIKVEINGISGMEALKAITIMVNWARRNGVPAEVVIAAVCAGLDEDGYKAIGEEIPLEQIADDTAISKEFADILRGLNKD